jgi:putative restriction endonuclease
MPTLTDTKIRTTKAEAKPYSLQDGSGLYLEVRPSGAKYWRERERVRKLVKQGINPTQEKKTERIRQIHERSNTFEAVAREWLDRKSVKWSPYYLKQATICLESNAFPKIGRLPIRKVTAAHLLEIRKDQACRVEEKASEVMTLPLLAELKLLTLAQLEKAAIDSGFDVVGGLANSLMAFRSSQSPLRIWLGVIEVDASTSQPVVGLSMPNVAVELRCPEFTAPVNIDGCHAWVTAHDLVDLDRILDRAFALSRRLPNQLLETWQSQVKTLSVPERESLVRQRVGQELFQEGLLALWVGRCAITGVDEPALLRASHAKPWKDASDSERLDVYNGLLLAAHRDTAFDEGLTVSLSPTRSCLMKHLLFSVGQKSARKLAH